MLLKDTKIYVAGHRGLVGSAIWKNLKNRGYHNLIGKTHSELDLTDQNSVASFFEKERPEVVVLAAAFVGGIMANSIYRADFIMQNMQMQCNVIGQAYKHGVKKLLFLGSTCIYPKAAPQPITEDSLLTGPLEYTNEEYAIAKIAGLKMCESYNLQYGTNYIAVMPTNLYGPNDNFHLENSHVMPAMMRKIYLAKLIHENDWNSIKQDLNLRPVVGVNGECDKDVILSTLEKYGISDNKVELWGTGTPLREFLWSEDMADACVHLLLNVDFKDIIGSNDIYKASPDNVLTNKYYTFTLKVEGRDEMVMPIMDFKYNDELFKKLLNGETITLDTNYYMAMGDNTSNSHDTRYFGLVAEPRIKGELLVRWWPLTRIGLL